MSGEFDGMDPVPVHLASVGDGLALGAAAPSSARRRKALRVNTYTLTAAVPTQRILPHSANRLEGWITAAAAAASLSNEQSLTAPTSFAELAAVTVGPGLYNVQWTIELSGTLATGTDNNNVRINTTGPLGAALTTGIFPAVAGVYPQNPVTILVSPGQTGIGLQVANNASAGSSYTGSITVTPLNGTVPSVIFIGANQSNAAAQGGGSAMLPGTDVTPFPVNTTDEVWVSAATGFPVAVSVLAIYDEAD